MEVKVLLETGEGFRRLYSISKSKGGIYVHDNSSQGDHFSYHNDGNCFYHSFNKRILKKVRDPIAEFRGIETLRVSAIMLNSGRPERKYSAKERDIVVRGLAPVWLELAISDTETTWTPPASHLESEFHAREMAPLWFIFEIYTKADNVAESFRFQKYNWEVGKNLFFLGVEERGGT